MSRLACRWPGTRLFGHSKLGKLVYNYYIGLLLICITFERFRHIGGSAKCTSTHLSVEVRQGEFRTSKWSDHTHHSPSSNSGKFTFAESVTSARLTPSLDFVPHDLVSVDHLLQILMSAISHERPSQSWFELRSLPALEDLTISPTRFVLWNAFITATVNNT